MEKPKLNEAVKKIFPKETELAKHGQCVFCEKIIRMEDFKDELSRKEYRISGICQSCQNKTFDL